MPTYREQVLADGAVAYWRLNEGSGLSFADEKATRPVTIASSAGLTYGVPGALSDGSTGLAVNGTHSQMTYPAYVVATTCTFEFWIIPAVAGSSFLGIVGNAAGGSGVYYDGPARKILVQHGGSTTLNTTALTIGTLYHIAISITAGSGTFYRNGVADGTFTGWPGNTFNALCGITSLIASLIDEVAIYPTALTPQQIATHYALRQTYDPYTQRVIEDGAVAYWKLDETSGTVAKSQVGSYDGTISGGVTLGQPGAISGYSAMAFDGVNGKIDLPNGAYLAVGTGSLTIELWLRRPSEASGRQICCFTGSKGFEVLMSPGNIGFTVGDGVGFPTANAAIALGNNLWHHVVAVVKRGATDQALIYVDGVQYGVATVATGADLTVSTAKIATHISNADWYAGQLDEVAIYPTALTPQQIAAHYQARTAWPDPPYAPTVPVDVYPSGNLSNRWLPLTPSDVVDAPFGKLWIGGAGNLTVVGGDGRVVTFAGVKAGTMLPLAGRRINATNTTATSILALRTQ